MSDLAGFVSIGQLHHALHTSAFGLAVKIKHGETISIKDYDNFIDQEQNFSHGVFNLRDELYEILFEIDSLTDILNRQAFFRVLSQEYVRALRTG